MRTVILPIESSRGSGRDLLKGIVNYSRIHGPWSFHWEPAGLDEVLPRLKDIKADGIILRDSKRITEILNMSIPMILVRHSQQELPGQITVVTDSDTIGRMAAEHLLERGLKYFAYCGLEGYSWSLHRRDAFRISIEKAGFNTDVFDCMRFPSWNDDRSRLTEWIVHLPKPVGMMCCNDDLGHQITQICKSCGIPIPDDIAIIGVDNDELVCGLSDPPLSSVAVNFERAGFECAALLDRLMQGIEVNKENVVVHATHIVTRRSTDIARVDDPEVAKAIQFIRNSGNKPIHVNDVVAAVSLTRRVLEKRFRKCLHRSILDEIRQTRANAISQMLVETNYSMLQIALSLGFSGTEHISRYFKKKKGMSLLQFRKKYGKK